MFVLNSLVKLTTNIHSIFLPTLLCLLRLITSPEQRLGRHGADEIKSHPFFAGVNWDTIRQIEAPFEPQLTSITDTSYFPTEDLDKVPEQPPQSGE